jgi:uncharacterized protein
MSLEFRPFGTRCNLRCRYCYEESTRARGEDVHYDKAAVWDALSATDSFWSLFGGEPLLLPLAQLEELLALAYGRFGRSSLQTNGSLITDRHVALFDKYRTHAGFSIDGPEELNDIRWAGTLEGTRKMTARSVAALETLAAKAVGDDKPHLRPSIIITLHAGNIGTPERQERLLAWLSDLDARGIQSCNLHVMEMDFEAGEWAVPHDTTIDFLRRLWTLANGFRQLRVAWFREVLALLRGNDRNVNCTWHTCDPWNTSAVEGLEGDGSPSHCTRTNKDGLAWLPAGGAGQPTVHAIGGFEGNRFHERQLSLYVTPQAAGGCQGCDYWLLCRGQCPGCGEASVAESQGDWRQRSVHCPIWKGLFAEGERRFAAAHERPITRHPRRQEMEHRLYGLWASGQDASVATLLEHVGGS